MEIEELRKLAEEFFEWDEDCDCVFVTLTSALLFAQHVLRMAQQQAEPQRVTMAHMDALHKAIDHVAALQNNRLRFRSACEISGDKHPEYVRGYEAAMDAVCKAQRFTATDEAQPAPIPTAWQPIETAPTDVFHVRGLWVHDKDGAPLYFETDAGFVDDDGHCFIDSAGNVYGWAAYQYTHWHPLDVPPAPGCSDD